MSKFAIYYYTVTKDGKEYRALAPYYSWDDVLEYLGVKRDEVKRGAESNLPRYIPSEWENKEQ